MRTSSHTKDVLIQCGSGCLDYILPSHIASNMRLDKFNIDSLSCSSPRKSLVKGERFIRGLKRNQSDVSLRKPLSLMLLRFYLYGYKPISTTLKDIRLKVPPQCLLWTVARDSCLYTLICTYCTKFLYFLSHCNMLEGTATSACISRAIPFPEMFEGPPVGLSSSHNGPHTMS